MLWRWIADAYWMWRLRRLRTPFTVTYTVLPDGTLPCQQWHVALEYPLDVLKYLDEYRMSGWSGKSIAAACRSAIPRWQADIGCYRRLAAGFEHPNCRHEEPLKYASTGSTPEA